MAYTTDWSVFPGEIPTSTKWNQLGENDDYLKAEIDGVKAALEDVALFIPREFGSLDITNDSLTPATPHTFDMSAIIPDGAIGVLMYVHMWSGSDNLATCYVAPTSGSNEGQGKFEFQTGAKANYREVHQVYIPLTPPSKSMVYYMGEGTAHVRLRVLGWYIPYSAIGA